MLKILINVLCFVGLFACSSYDKEKLNAILGVAVEIEKKIFSSEEWGGIRGDGYALTIYKLSQQTIDDFINNSERESFPNLAKSEDWELFTWKSTPIKSDYSEIYSMVLDYSSKNPDLKKQIEHVRSIFEKDNFYYAFYSKNGIEYPYHIEFYLIDPAENDLYIFDIKV